MLTVSSIHHVSIPVRSRGSGQTLRIVPSSVAAPQERPSVESASNPSLHLMRIRRLEQSVRVGELLTISLPHSDMRPPPPYAPPAASVPAASVPAASAPPRRWTYEDVVQRLAHGTT